MLDYIMLVAMASNLIAVALAVEDDVALIDHRSGIEVTAAVREVVGVPVERKFLVAGRLCQGT